MSPTDVKCFLFVVATLRVVGGLENLRPADGGMKVSSTKPPIHDEGAEFRDLTQKLSIRKYSIFVFLRNQFTCNFQGNIK